MYQKFYFRSNCTILPAIYHVYLLGDPKKKMDPKYRTFDLVCNYTYTQNILFKTVSYRMKQFNLNNSKTTAETSA